MVDDPKYITGNYKQDFNPPKRTEEIKVQQKQGCKGPQDLAKS